MFHYSSKIFPFFPVKFIKYILTNIKLYNRLDFSEKVKRG